MSKKNNLLLGSIMCSLILGMSAAPVSAETIETFNLDEMIVESSRNHKTPLPGGFNNDSARVGLLGETEVIKAPFTVQSITEDTVSKMAMPNQDLDTVLSNVPAIRTGTSPIKTDFSIRGLCTNAASYYVNNIPGFFIMATGPITNTVGSIDAMIGPAATLNGSTPSFQAGYLSGATPGAIYLNTKRAGENDFIKYTQTFGGYGDYGEYLDISQRFGKDRNIGVRIYGQYDDGGMAISGAGQRKKNLFANISYEGETTKTNVFGGYYDQKLMGTERRFSLHESATKFPGAPDNKMSFDDPKVMHQDTNGYMLTLNHQKKLGEHVNWFVNSGMNQSVVRRFIYNSEFMIDENGNVKGSGAYPWSDHIYIQNQYLQTGLKGDFMTGMAKHNMAVSVDRSHRKYYKSFKNRDDLGTTGNIYTGLIFKPGIYGADESTSLKKRFNQEETIVSLNFMDKVEIGKFTLVGALSRRHGDYVPGYGPKSGKEGPNYNKELKDSNWTPTYGLSYAPTEKLSFYAAQSTARNRGSFVDDNKALNNNDFLDATKLKNTEFGIKAKPNENLSMSIAYFDMTQPNTLKTYSATAPGKYWVSNNGKNRFKGVDFSIDAKLADKWNTFGGFEWLNAKQEVTTDKRFEGLPTHGSVKWSGVWGLEYKPDEDTSFTSRLSYTGTGKFVHSKSVRVLDIPSYVTLDLFASHKTKINNVPVKFTAACYNVTNDSHWIAQVGQTDKFMLNNPRSFMLSAEFEF
ncbi:TonB-dependent siderophore receptor [uncultured Phascolarctobacterium sp.]|uniref:TonB-dependent receptor n=1 Tax=uncultured Phascolarctobacterium sp. TaxID=512296 RepID=UPI0025F10DA8|nr:TonB-dependent receptor [uncultured Phascolarctobacterium sp.]